MPTRVTSQLSYRVFPGRPFRWQLSIITRSIDLHHRRSSGLSQLSRSVAQSFRLSSQNLLLRLGSPYRCRRLGSPTDYPGHDDARDERARLLKTAPHEPRYANVPVILYTADFDDDTTQAGLKAGADQVLIKGTIRWSEFQTIIERYLSPPVPVDERAKTPLKDESPT